MNAAAEDEIKRLVSSASEPGSVEPAVRAAMVWMARDIAQFFGKNHDEWWSPAIVAVIEERLK